MLGRPLQRQAMQSAWPIYNTKWTIALKSMHSVKVQSCPIPHLAYHLMDNLEHFIIQS